MIFVYQMLKVASQTWLQAAQAACGPGAPEPVHVHFIGEANLAKIADIAATTGERQTIRNPILLRAMLRKGPAARAKLDDARSRGETVRVLTGMRDPVARSLSLLHFFADFYGDVSRPLDRIGGGDGADTANAVREAWRAVLADQEPQDSFGRLTTFLIARYRDWFAEELESVFPVKLGSGPAPAPGGVIRLSAEGVEALAYRVEDMATSGEARARLIATVSDFLGAPIADLADVNSAATRRSYARYSAARATLRLPAAALDAIYDAPIVSRFYAQDEIGAFKARWR